MIATIGTHIKVKDFDKSLRFYETLGFQKVFEYGPDKNVKEAYNGTVFAAGGCKLEIADGHRAVKKGVFGGTVIDSKISLMINVDSIKEIIDRAALIGVLPAVGVRHYYWNTLEVVFRDPDGVVLVFIEPYTKESAESLNADETFGIAPQ